VNPFIADVREQGAVLGRVLDAYSGPEAGLLAGAAALVNPDQGVLFTGMGSSLAVSRAVATRLGWAGVRASAQESGELLHYGVTPRLRDTLVVVVSQSGRSAEAVALVERLRDIGSVRVVAIVNDTGSRVAALSDAVLPMHAGTEATVSTKTFAASLVIAQMLGDAIAGCPGATMDLALRSRLPTVITALAEDDGYVQEAAEALSAASALAVVARGPALPAAEYAGLINKEMTAIPTEGMAGASFRHGPLEIAGPSVGVVVLDDPTTAELSRRLARDTAYLGSPTWLLTSARAAAGGRLNVSRIPAVPAPLAPLPFSVALQLLAARLAVSRGREPGSLTRATKVTDTE
jgi:glucosamine--fructose-6-phosphate aminotransferase (isomerizing)